MGCADRHTADYRASFTGRPAMTLRDEAIQALHQADREEWLTVKEFAALKRVNEETVRRWIREKRIEAERTIEPHGHWRIKRIENAA